MSRIENIFLKNILISTLSLSSLASAEPVVIFQEDFEDENTDLIIGSQAGGQVEINRDSTANYAGSKGSLKGTYPIPEGAVYIWTTANISQHNTNDIYIEFKAKMPGNKEGCKFLKVFGQNPNNDSNYSNTTLAADYAGNPSGAIRQVSFGDGSVVGNDTANVIHLDGAYPQWIGRSFGSANVKTPQQKEFSVTDWGDTWHHFRVRIKYNSGSTASTQVADGAYYLEIDGEVYVDAKGVFNRHYSNKPIDRVELFGWAQSGSRSFELWYDDLIISTGGFTSSPAKSSPQAPDSLATKKIN